MSRLQYDSGKLVFARDLYYCLLYTSTTLEIDFPEEVVESLDSANPGVEINEEQNDRIKEYESFMIKASISLFRLVRTNDIIFKGAFQGQ